MNYETTLSLDPSILRKGMSQRKGKWPGSKREGEGKGSRAGEGEGMNPGAF